jgi:predicted nucleic acid-binding protein
VQAQEKRAHFFIVDEKRAREIAQRRGLILVGTVRLLARLSLEGLADEPKALVSKLRKDLNFRISEEVISAAVAQATNPI